ncbi:gamma-glutamyltranspeptidase [Rhizobium leguminosarum bv. trifolii]|uniref:gamma-glutamyltransferase n=1 Tax=Rhizobium leguminosarum TaxID=384 RepID=UPI000E361849|nr:gamma-glutamyltransferase [Rhizobium leguminosarum]RFB86090.1 gamma-glutamyltranspeptidase [Rhizobium leguminosarum bv. trifolii]
MINSDEIAAHGQSVHNEIWNNDFGISTNQPAATSAANAVRLQGGGVFDMYLAALACAWVTDPANCSPYGRMQGVFSCGGVVGCLSAATRIRSAANSTVPVPGNIAAWFWFRDTGRLRLSFRDLVAPAISAAENGFTPSRALAIAVHASSRDLSQDLRTIYLDESGNLRSVVRNPCLAELLRVLAGSADEKQFWQALRSRDPGPWRSDDKLENPVSEVSWSSLLVAGPDGNTERLLSTGNLETWGTWTLVGAAIAAKLRSCGALDNFARAAEAYVLSTILLLERIPFVVGSLEPKVCRPSVDLDITSEAEEITQRVVHLMNASVDTLQEELGKTYFGDPGIHTDDTNTNVFTVACGDDVLSFTTSIGPWFGSKRSWWGAGLGFSYVMKSGSMFEGQTHDVTEMSPLIIELGGWHRVAIGAAGSERILGALTYLLFQRFGLGLRDDMARLISNPRIFPKDGKIRVHRDFCHTTRLHLESRGFALALVEYDLERHLGIVNLVERLDSGKFRSGTDPSGDGWAI